MKRQILFVDDDLNLLGGIKRSLRSFREDWHIHIAETGAQALELLKQYSIDVIVSDMKMPEMNGTQLLRQAAQISPNTVRIILTGQSNELDTMASLPLAHQFISKPTTAKTIVEKIDRAWTIAGALDNAIIQNHLTKMGKVPMAPETYRLMLAELDKQDCSIDVIGDIVQKDSLISLKILQIVNSAFFGLPRQFQEPREATTFLGLEIVSALVLNVGVFYETAPELIAEFELGRIMEHNNRVATYAKSLAILHKLDKNTVSLVMTAGLLHDIGLLIVASVAPEILRQIMSYQENHHSTLKEAELITLGAIHAQVGAYLLGIWGLPTDVIKLVLFQDRTDTDEQLDVCDNNLPYQLLCAANRFDEINTLPRPYWIDGDSVTVNENLLKQLGLPEPK